MLNIFNSKERQARRLNRDADAIIEADSRNHDQIRLQKIAQQTNEYLQQAQERLKNDPDGDYRNLAHLETEHKKARRQPNQLALSAATLAIIYLRAEKLGDDCKPALNAIEEFIEKWTA